MKPVKSEKCLKTLERVKGIEPSYSAWKAAALPLSYTRATDELTRRPRRLNRPAAAVAAPLTRADSQPMFAFPSTMKGGDPVSLTKRCHLAGIAR